MNTAKYFCSALTNYLLKCKSVLILNCQTCDSNIGSACSSLDCSGIWIAIGSYCCCCKEVLNFPVCAKNIHDVVKDAHWTYINSWSHYAKWSLISLDQLAILQQCDCKNIVDWVHFTSGIDLGQCERSVIGQYCYLSHSWQWCRGFPQENHSKQFSCFKSDLLSHKYSSTCCPWTFGL